MKIEPTPLENTRVVRFQGFPRRQGGLIEKLKWQQSPWIKAC